MAMLTEPKRRTKWSLNPRGKLWSEDDSKFGQKLMEKMGWSKGSGLGKDEQGSTDHIHVRLKDNTKGVGYKGKDNEWLKHYDAFENILSTLSESNSTNNSSGNSDTEGHKPKFSLEEKSKGSKSRLHYKKFTRSKDLSRYGADDLACILGSKKARRDRVVEEEIEALTAPAGENPDNEEMTENSHGVVTLRGGCLQAYFAQKMKKIRANGDEYELEIKEEPADEIVDNLCDNIRLEEEEETIEEEPGILLHKMKIKKKLGIQTSKVFHDDSLNGKMNMERRKAKGKKNRLLEDSEALHFCDEEETIDKNVAINIKKPKKNRIDDRYGMIDVASEEECGDNFSDRSKEKLLEDPILSSAVSQRSKKKKSNLVEDATVDTEKDCFETVEELPIMGNDVEILAKRKKKKNENSKGPEENIELIENVVAGKKKKKQIEIVNLVKGDQIETNQNVEEEIPVEISKKIRKHKREKLQGDVNFSDEMLEETCAKYKKVIGRNEETESEEKETQRILFEEPILSYAVSHRSKKKKSKLVEDAIVDTEKDCFVTVEELPEMRNDVEILPKRKKKKSKKSKDAEEDIELIENAIEKKKRKKEIELGNLAQGDEMETSEETVKDEMLEETRVTCEKMKGKNVTRNNDVTDFEGKLAATVYKKEVISSTTNNVRQTDHFYADKPDEFVPLETSDTNKIRFHSKGAWKQFVPKKALEEAVNKFPGACLTTIRGYEIECSRFMQSLKR